MKRLAQFIILIALVLPVAMAAHPQPNSVILLDVHQQKINCELQIPVSELQLALGFEAYKDFLATHKQQLIKYLQNHLKIKDAKGNVWPMVIGAMQVKETQQTDTGMYKELVTAITFIPPVKSDTRKFTVYYDAVMHQVLNHKAIVSIRQDWETGSVGENQTEIGSIFVDTHTLKVYPLRVNLAEGSNWKGFKGMVMLGIKHIAEGTDHLMFLLVLLLTAPLISRNKRWTALTNNKKAALKTLKISIAFTIGHSITLILATLGLVRFPVQPVEVIIALSILITAVHAIKPFFPYSENSIACGFGLIHGLAFSTVLSGLHLSSGKLALSLLGFNIGIELMQLFVILLVMPWLLLISRYRFYALFKNILALLSIAAATCWIAQRVLNKENVFSQYLEAFSRNSILFVAFLCVVGMLCLAFGRKKRFLS